MLTGTHFFNWTMSDERKPPLPPPQCDFKNHQSPQTRRWNQVAEQQKHSGRVTPQQTEPRCRREGVTLITSAETRRSLASFQGFSTSKAFLARFQRQTAEMHHLAVRFDGRAGSFFTSASLQQAGRCFPQLLICLPFSQWVRWWEALSALNRRRLAFLSGLSLMTNTTQEKSPQWRPR